jgi:tetratricopeptide (TPR) repeat protein
MDPDNLVALRDLSRGLALTGQLDEAAATAARASELAPWSARAVAVLADIEFRRGDVERALDLADRALEIDPDFVEARVDRSRYLAALGRTDEAATELTTLLEVSPDDPWVTLRYVELVGLPAGAFDDAETRLRAVVSRNPSFVEARLLLGAVLTRAGRPADAVAVYREAVAADPTHPEALARLGLLLAELGDPAGEQALRTAIESSPIPRADLHLALGRLLASRGDSSEARRQLELAAAAPAATADTRNARATALLLLGRPGEAQTVWTDLTEDRPDYASAWTNLASLAIRDRKWADAESFARAAIERDPLSTGAWNTLGIALDELGRTDDAEAAYRRAGELDPGDWQALFNLGILLRTNARYQEAVEVQQEVLNRSPGNPGAHFELGMLYAGFLGDADRAKLHLRATIEAAPDHPRARQARMVLDRLP